VLQLAQALMEGVHGLLHLRLTGRLNARGRTGTPRPVTGPETSYIGTLPDQIRSNSALRLFGWVSVSRP
jgi:hypothetical protein